jgi:heptose-I-phosphate ethanolaminephosphotransferase
MLKKSLFFLGIIIPFLFLSTQINYLGAKVVLSYFLAALFLILICNLIKKRYGFIITVFFTSIFFTFFCFIEFAFVHIFKHKIGINAIYVLLESNKNEASEFLTVYFKPELYVLTALFVMAIFFSSVFAYRQFYNSRGTKLPRILNYGTMVVCIVALYLKGSLLPIYGAQIVNKYQKQQQKISEIPISKNGNFKNVKSVLKADKELHVLIIGESTTRNHMGLYDYYRKTNPLLSKRKEELLIYKDVISPHTHTLESLDKALILENKSNLAEKYNHTLVQLFNAAGFSTYWLSNQEPLGVFGNSTRIISKTSGYEHFTDGMMLDNIILEPLQEALNNEEEKKFIVIHLMATHFDYESRYPSDYEYFKSKPKSNFNHELAYDKINKYDNAVLYNDFILDQIINVVANQNKHATVLYLSDHGEDVYETIDEACHTEAKGTKPMFDIPFFIWQSKKAKLAKADIIYKSERKYISTDLIHTMADLTGIEFQGFDKTKSIINESFQERDRLILNNRKYEEVFSIK